MKNNVKPAILIGLIFIVSLFSAIYLQKQDFFEYHELTAIEFSDTYVSDNNILPDVKFLKEVLKSFFNIIKLS
ncbi:MAG: hypothetical protein RIR48_1646 [Bacteroidota bacterium]|jgi:hypothetical protein